MPMQLHEDPTEHVVEVVVTDKLTDRDYKRFAPQMDRFIRQHGKIRLLFVMYDFHGFEIGSMWEDFKFGVKHRHDLERLAMVGETYWEWWSSKLCRFFTDAKVCYFDGTHADDAKAWVRNN
jgi:hypothetical protein